MRKSQIVGLIEFLRAPRSMEEITSFTGKSDKTIYRWFKRIENEKDMKIDREVDADGIIRYSVKELMNQDVFQRALYKSLAEFKGKIKEELILKKFSNIFISNLKEVACRKIDYMAEHSSMLLKDLEIPLFYKCYRCRPDHITREYYGVSEICWLDKPPSYYPHYIVDLPGICIFISSEGVGGGRTNIQIYNKYLLQHVRSGYPEIYRYIEELQKNRNILYEKIYKLVNKIWRKAYKLDWTLNKYMPADEYTPLAVYNLYRASLNAEDPEFKAWYRQLKNKDNVKRVLDEKILKKGRNIKGIINECVMLDEKITDFLIYLDDLRCYKGILKGECDMCSTYKIKFI